MSGGGAPFLRICYLVNAKYHPILVLAVEKMMRCNAASLMAGGGAHFYLDFATGSSDPYISSVGPFINLNQLQIHCSPHVMRAS